MEHKIIEIYAVGGDTESERKVIAILENGTDITIESCYESWQQYGGTTDELWATYELAELCNGWLHNECDELPDDVWELCDKE